MKLSHYELIPGVVTETNCGDTPFDIKYNAVTAFDNSKFDVDLIDPIKPLFKINTPPNKGDNIFVLHEIHGKNTSDKYLIAPVLTDNEASLSTNSQGKNNDVLSTIDNGSNISSITNGADGITLDTGSGSNIVLGKSNNIVISANKDNSGASIKIDGTNVTIGSDNGKTSYLVDSDVLEDLFKTISNTFSECASSFLNNEFAKAATACYKAASDINNSIKELKKLNIIFKS